MTNPARTAAAKYAHSRFCIPSPAVAPEPRRTPKRCLAMPRAGISRMLLIVSPIPSNVESARCWVIRSRTDPVATYGASIQKLMATAFWALPSAVSERVRAPVNLQMTMTLAKPSTPDDRAQPTSAMDPAANRATSTTVGTAARPTQGDRIETPTGGFPPPCDPMAPVLRPVKAAPGNATPL